MKAAAIEAADAPRYQPGASTGNDGGPGYQPGPPVEQSARTCQ